MSQPIHRYATSLTWEGNTGQGTASYAGYQRTYRIRVAGKPDLWGSADPAFRGDPARHNPEDLFLAALSACHQLTSLALCARKGLRVVAYADEASATLTLDASGGGSLTEVVLRPRVVLGPGQDVEQARALHELAHHHCFLAASTATPIRVEPSVEVGP